MFRIVALEKAGVHQNSPDSSGQAQTDDAPIVPGGSAAARFPPIHPFSARRVLSFDKNRLGLLPQVFLPGEEFILHFKPPASQPFRCQIRELRKIVHVVARHKTRPPGAPGNSPLSKILRPRRKVASITPASSRPA